jgi:DNA-binding NtrC family response regulator
MRDQRQSLTDLTAPPHKGSLGAEPSLALADGPTFAPPPDPGDLGLLHGASRAIRRVRQQLAAVAARARRVRLEGERGTGKNLAAQYLHRLWRPPGAPFVEINLAAVSAADGRELGELLGWTSGAFTGAQRDLPGLLEMAHDGSPFLNELATASPRLQLILLRLLERHDVQRLGERRERHLDLRIISATNEDLKAAVARREFRADLFDRLGQVVIRMPALRDRVEDLPAIATGMMQRLAAAVGVAPLALGPAVLDRLRRYHWPGNLRELESTIEAFLTFGQLPEHFNRVTGKGWDRGTDLEQRLAEHDGNVSALARAVGKARSTVYEALGRRSRSGRVSGSLRRGHLSDTLPTG